MKSRLIQNNTPIKEGKPMKPIAILSLFAAILLTSCSTTRPGVTVYDDVYYTPGDPVVHVKEVVISRETVVQDAPDQNQEVYYNDENLYYTEPGYEEPYTETKYYTDPTGGSVINNYYYGDYYDYSYTSRIRRFHRPYGFGSYYHDYYTNMYWYNYDPHYWGTSIYIGYGWGWPRSSFWSAWYNPYYMYGMGYPHYYYGSYSSYWTGYRHGYWDGYYGNPYYGGGWYKNSYDQNSYYYGPRTGFAGNTGSGTAGGSGRPTTFGERYEKALAAETTSRSADPGSRGSRPEPTGEGVRGSRPSAAEGTRPTTEVQRGESRITPQEPGRTGIRETTPTREGQRPVTSPAEGRQTIERPATETRPDRSVAPNQRTYQYGRQDSPQAPGYERPDIQRQQPAQTQRRPQPYSSPRYTKPKTSEEFTSPAYRSPREATRPAESSTPQRQEAAPSTQRPGQPQTAPSPQRQPSPQTVPGREQQSQPRYTPPSRPSDNRQSTPPSQYSPPTRSTTPPASRPAPNYTPPRSSTPPPSSSPGISSPSRSSSPPPSRSSSPSVSSPSRSSGGSAPSRGSSSGSSGSSGTSSRSSGRGNR